MDKVVSLDKIRKNKVQKPKSAPLANHEAQAKINNLAKDSFNIYIPKKQHAEQRQEERDFTRSDIEEILRDGIIIDNPRWEKGNWRYKLEIKGFRGRIGAGVVTIIMEETSKLLVVTAMWKDRRW